MTEQQNREFLLNAMNDLFKKKVTELSDEQLLVELDLNSLDIVELQMYYEEKTNRIIPDSTSAIRTVADLLNLMK